MFPSGTWIIDEQDKARGWNWAWLRKALLLSSFCCSDFTCTAGAYITVRLHVLTTPPTIFLPFPSPLTYWFVLVFTSVPTSTSFTPNTRVQRLTQMSNQHLCLCRLWIGHDPPSADSVPCGKKSKSSFESWKSMWVLALTEKQRGWDAIYKKRSQFHKWPFTAQIVD